MATASLEDSHDSDLASSYDEASSDDEPPMCYIVAIPNCDRCSHSGTARYYTKYSTAWRRVDMAFETLEEAKRYLDDEMLEEYDESRRIECPSGCNITCPCFREHYIVNVKCQGCYATLRPFVLRVEDDR